MQPRATAARRSSMRSGSGGGRPAAAAGATSSSHEPPSAPGWAASCRSGRRPPAACCGSKSPAAHGRGGLARPSHALQQRRRPRAQGGAAAALAATPTSDVNQGKKRPARHPRRPAVAQRGIEPRAGCPAHRPPTHTLAHRLQRLLKWRCSVKKKEAGSMAQKTAGSSAVLQHRQQGGEHDLAKAAAAAGAHAPAPPAPRLPRLVWLHTVMRPRPSSRAMVCW